MTTIEARHTPPAKRTKPVMSGKSEKPKATGKPEATRAAPSRKAASDNVHATRITKHDRILTLLSRRDGVTIAEMMEVSGWQQHSVRGFLAGTVKKKLGLTLVSSKADGNVRRYRIVDAEV